MADQFLPSSLLVVAGRPGTGGPLGRTSTGGMAGQAAVADRAASRKVAVQVAGTTELERDEQGDNVPRKAPVHLHFQVVQGGIVVSGRTQTLEEVWTGSTTASRDLLPGPAQAGGLAIITRNGPPPAFETFTWFQELLLDTGTPSPPP